MVHVIKAQVRDVGVSSLAFSFSSHRGGKEARSSSAKLQNEKLREARRSKECEARRNIICDGSRIHSFAQEGNNGQD